MKRIITLVAFFLLSQFISAQIVINELDCDTPSIDDKEFVELKSVTPNFALDGYVVVFFNGNPTSSTANKSYLAIDLDGYTTDVNGLLLIGSTTVSPFPQLVISPNLIQNGGDAVAIYQASYTDFPEGTLATQTNLIDALMYDTSDSDATALMALLGETIQINEGPANNTNSIQLNNDGTTYTVTTPTPRQLNDGSGIVLNGITISVAQTEYDEGDVFDITFTSETNVTEDLDLTFSLNNGGFNTSDFTGSTSVTIPNGLNTISSTITLVDDTNDEGDEVLEITLSALPTAYFAFNNDIEIRVVDNDFVVAPWGIPTNPTFGIVQSTQPAGYYDSLDGLADVNLRQALQDIIADPATVRAQTYTDVIDILKEADQNPANSNQVWLVYTEQGRAKLDYQTTSNNFGTWNREHTYPRSRGGFDSIDLDDIADGKNVYWTTEADSLRHGNSDAHALRAADGPENSSRGNQHYGEYTGPTGNLGSFKGDVARSVLYMEIRYNGLEVVNGFPDVVGQLGDLATILDWHRNDPPDDFEMNRNNIVYEWQFNRNPFIDQPDLVEYFWGTNVGDIWSQPLGVDEVNALNVHVYPNPTTNKIYFKGLLNEAVVKVFTLDGRQLSTNTVSDNSALDLNVSSGIYMLRILSNGRSVIKKIIVQ